MGKTYRLTCLLLLFGLNPVSSECPPESSTLRRLGSTRFYIEHGNERGGFVSQAEAREHCEGHGLKLAKLRNMLSMAVVSRELEKLTYQHQLKDTWYWLDAVYDHKTQQYFWGSVDENDPVVYNNFLYRPPRPTGTGAHITHNRELKNNETLSQCLTLALPWPWPKESLPKHGMIYGMQAIFDERHCESQTSRHALCESLDSSCNENKETPFAITEKNIEYFEEGSWIFGDRTYVLNWKHRTYEDTEKYCQSLGLEVMSPGLHEKFLIPYLKMWARGVTMSQFWTNLKYNPSTRKFLDPKGTPVASHDIVSEKDILKQGGQSTQNKPASEQTGRSMHPHLPKQSGRTITTSNSSHSSKPSAKAKTGTQSKDEVSGKKNIFGQTQQGRSMQYEPTIQTTKSPKKTGNSQKKSVPQKTTPSSKQTGRSMHTKPLREKNSNSLKEKSTKNPQQTENSDFKPKPSQPTKANGLSKHKPIQSGRTMQKEESNQNKKQVQTAKPPEQEKSKHKSTSKPLSKNSILMKTNSHKQSSKISQKSGTSNNEKSTSTKAPSQTGRSMSREKSKQSAKLVQTQKGGSKGRKIRSIMVKNFIPPKKKKNGTKSSRNKENVTSGDEERPAILQRTVASDTPEEIQKTTETPKVANVTRKPDSRENTNHAKNNGKNQKGKGTGREKPFKSFDEPGSTDPHDEENEPQDNFIPAGKSTNYGAKSRKKSPLSQTSNEDNVPFNKNKIQGKIYNKKDDSKNPKNNVESDMSKSTTEQPKHKHTDHKKIEAHHKINHRDNGKNSTAKPRKKFLLKQTSNEDDPWPSYTNDQLDKGNFEPSTPETQTEKNTESILITSKPPQHTLSDTEKPKNNHHHHHHHQANQQGKNFQNDSIISTESPQKSETYNVDESSIKLPTASDLHKESPKGKTKLPQVDVTTIPATEKPQKKPVQVTTQKQKEVKHKPTENSNVITDPEQLNLQLDSLKDKPEIAIKAAYPTTKHPKHEHTASGKPKHHKKTHHHKNHTQNTASTPKETIMPENTKIADKHLFSQQKGLQKNPSNAKDMTKQVPTKTTTKQFNEQPLTDTPVTDEPEETTEKQQQNIQRTKNPNSKMLGKGSEVIPKDIVQNHPELQFKPLQQKITATTTTVKPKKNEKNKQFVPDTKSFNHPNETTAPKKMSVFKQTSDSKNPTPKHNNTLLQTRLPKTHNQTEPKTGFSKHASKKQDVKPNNAKNQTKLNNLNQTAKVLQNSKSSTNSKHSDGNTSNQNAKPLQNNIPKNRKDTHKAKPTERNKGENPDLRPSQSGRSFIKRTTTTKPPKKSESPENAVVKHKDFPKAEATPVQQGRKIQNSPPKQMGRRLGGSDQYCVALSYAYEFKEQMPCENPQSNPNCKWSFMHYIPANCYNYHAAICQHKSGKEPITFPKTNPKDIAGKLLRDDSLTKDFGYANNSDFIRSKYKQTFGNMYCPSGYKLLTVNNKIWAERPKDVKEIYEYDYLETYWIVDEEGFDKEETSTCTISFVDPQDGKSRKTKSVVCSEWHFYVCEKTGKPEGSKDEKNPNDKPMQWKDGIQARIYPESGKNLKGYNTLGL